MNRPRVLHLIHHLRVGGAETLLVELLPRLAEAGFEVQVGCLEDRGPLFDALGDRGIPGHFIGRRRGLDPAAVWRLAGLLRRLRIHILNTHSFSAGFWGRVAAVLARTPRVVTTVHTVAGWSQPWKQRLGNRLLLPATDRVVAVSESVRRSLIAQGLPSRLTRIIHNGIRVERFRRTSDAPADRTRLGLPAGGFLIGMLARCSREKGGDTWLRAIVHLVRAGMDVQGVLVGDGPALAAWKALAETEGLAARIHFVGAQADVVPWLAVLDVLVCPSTQESFGIAALEAQAAGVPVVATRVDGFLETLHDGENALLVQADDPRGIAGAVRRLLNSPALARRLRDAGMRNAARYRIESCAAEYAALYDGLLAGPGLPIRVAPG